MSNPPFVITGLDDLTRELSALPEAIVSDLFPEALAVGGEVMRQELHARTPESAGSTSAKKYGTLRADLDTDIEMEPLAGSAKVGFGDTGFVARFVEFGHREVTRKREEIGAVDPHPFMRPAASAAADKAVEAFAVSMATHK